MELGLWAAILIGGVAGLWSTFGYVIISPLLEKIHIHDTCGIHNLHGMPGLIGGISSLFAILAGNAKNTNGLADSDRSSQAMKQIYGMLATLAFAIVGGLACGLAAKLYGEADFEAYEDAFWWTTGWVKEEPAPVNGANASKA